MLLIASGDDDKDLDLLVSNPVPSTIFLLLLVAYCGVSGPLLSSKQASSRLSSVSISFSIE